MIGTIKSTNKENRPYEKLISKGPEALTDSELLAIIIRTGTYDKTSVELAEEVLNQSNGQGVIGLINLSVKELMNIKGIGIAKAVQIKSISELSRRIAKSHFSISNKKEFVSPEIIAGYYMEDMRHLSTEHLMVIMLNTKYRFIGDYQLSKGTVNSSLASPREIFIKALKSEAVYIVLIHNHPSGDPTPSREDLIITKRIKDAGNIIGISLIDHIIIGDNNYISLKQQNLF
ncbi:MAG: DNA repair protein RadC [Lachnospiraceae bacterium]|nr:DNA repair protein RadC [Lachnospiraceae bacterium]